MFMRTSKNLKKHELIGLQARISSSENPANKGICGKIVDETQHTLVIEHDGKDKRVFKNCIEIEIEIDSQKIKIDGKDLEGRPWDRIKKMTATKKETKKKEVKRTKTIAKAKPKTAKPVKPVAKEVKQETVECKDRFCPIHGNLKVRGRVFEGKVIKAIMMKTVTVEWPRIFYMSKYERFEKRRSKVKAHNPQCINAKVGDTVKIAECRPLSKTKNFVILEVVKE